MYHFFTKNRINTILILKVTYFTSHFNQFLDDHQFQKKASFNLLVITEFSMDGWFNEIYKTSSTIDIQLVKLD